MYSRAYCFERNWWKKQLERTAAANIGPLQSKPRNKWKYSTLYLYMFRGFEWRAQHLKLANFCHRFWLLDVRGLIQSTNIFKSSYSKVAFILNFKMTPHCIQLQRLFWHGPLYLDFHDIQIERRWARDQYICACINHTTLQFCNSCKQACFRAIILCWAKGAGGPSKKE
jgi:hypothetical protein